MPEPVEETSVEISEPEIIAPSSISTTPTPSLEEDDDEFDDGTDDFSFYKFSILHFQGNATHEHITQRLRQPLLPHDDEGDALVRGQRGSRNGFLSVRDFHLLPALIPRFSSHFPPGMPDCFLDYTAFHGGHARTKICGHDVSRGQHRLASYASTAGQEAEPPGGTRSGNMVTLLHVKSKDNGTLCCHS